MPCLDDILPLPEPDVGQIIHIGNDKSGCAQQLVEFHASVLDNRYIPVFDSVVCGRIIKPPHHFKLIAAVLQDVFRNRLWIARILSTLVADKGDSVFLDGEDIEYTEKSPAGPENKQFDKILHD